MAPTVTTMLIQPHRDHSLSTRAGYCRDRKDVPACAAVRNRGWANRMVSEDFSVSSADPNAQ